MQLCSGLLTIPVRMETPEISGAISSGARIAPWPGEESTGRKAWPAARGSNPCAERCPTVNLPHAERATEKYSVLWALLKTAELPQGLSRVKAAADATN